MMRALLRRRCCRIRIVGPRIAGVGVDAKHGSVEGRGVATGPQVLGAQGTTLIVGIVARIARLVLVGAAELADSRLR